MFRLNGVRRSYAWGSETLIPAFLGRPCDADPFAELWFGTHPTGSARTEDGLSLRDLVAADPERLLGADVAGVLGPELPYMMKLIAPGQPISLQLHPTKEQAQRGHAAEEAEGIAIEASNRLYRDTNHKPEMVYALSRFEALSGFRAPRRAIEILASLDAAIARRMLAVLREAPSDVGMRRAFVEVLTTGRNRPEEIDELVQVCRSRSAADSTSPRIDAIVSLLGEHFPGDPGIATALLLNPVTLEPGEAVFVPAGCVHIYLSGLAVELMASSDNVLRAGLTVKHIDVDAVLELVDCVAAPPMRIAPEPRGPQQTFYAPVEDFELSVVALHGGGAGGVGEAVTVRGRGPRILLGLDGVTVVSAGGVELELRAGAAAFVGADEGAVTAHAVGGPARLAQAAIP